MPEIRLNLKLWEALLVVAAGIVGSVGGDTNRGDDAGIGLLCLVAAAAGFGVWRCVQLLGQLVQLKQAEIFDEDTQ